MHGENQQVVYWKERETRRRKAWSQVLAPHPKSLEFCLHFFICKMAITFYGLGEKNLYKSICKAGKAVTLTSYSNISLNYFCTMTIVHKFNHKPP